MLNNMMMTVTFADGQRFHRLIDGRITDDDGRELTLETHVDVFDDVLNTFTPNAVLAKEYATTLTACQSFA